nr:MAG TPA: Interleukin-6 receptor subunit beta-like, FNIII, Cell membrane, Disulfide [Caudoviricetes sp.]
MPIFTVQASGSTAVAKNHPNTNYSNLAQYKLFADPFTGEAGNVKQGDNIYIKFPVPGDAYKFKRVSKVTLSFYAQPTEDSGNGNKQIWTYVNAVESQFDTSVITYATRPEISQTYTGISEHADGKWTALNEIVQLNAVFDLAQYRVKKEEVKKGIENGFVIAFRGAVSGTSEAVFYGEKSTRKPFLTCEYSNDNVGIKADNLSPSAGAFVNRAQKNTFTWDAEDDTDLTQVCFAEVKQTAAVFEWRVKNASTSKTISVSGSTTACTVPANTFPSGTLEWRVKVTANSGTTTTSAWQEITTTDVTPTAKPVSPSGIVIDATIVNRFSWKHIISTGTPQSKANLQWSADGTTWNTLTTVTGENQYYDVPANKFTSGTKYWRVRTYNTDGTPSEWSDKAEFIAINAPSAPSIVIQSTGPRPRITWQTSEQEAYQLTLSNGYASGTVYGTEKAWRSPVYLADGSYTIRVRVQNKYGMWSEWSAAALPVSHTEGEAITLSAGASHEAALTWQTAGSYDFYLIERDGVAIGRTVQKQYIDHTSIGSVTYRVRGCYADSDNYGVSNSDTVEVLPETNMICDLETGVWLEMRLSETQLRTNRTSFSAGVSTVHLAGLAYPVEERSEQRDRALSVACAWPHAQRAAALALEALVGRLVCLKDRYGNMAIGSLPSLESNCDEFMRRYSFTISHTNRKEAITLDP